MKFQGIKWMWSLRSTTDDPYETFLFQGIKWMWSLRSTTDDPYETFLVVSFISETHILAMNMKDEWGETEIKGFRSNVQTLLS
ncbi:DNA damage-binding protein 1a [Castilleja foliolosa]|uniref:DNA damage-binding protein 1a n=1 Tax=Castilleja foliolosa TaxID=1961234 RepID=A0ABD3E0S5_9LAMI